MSLSAERTVLRACSTTAMASEYFSSLSRCLVCPSRSSSSTFFPYEATSSTLSWTSLSLTSRALARDRENESSALSSRAKASSILEWPMCSLALVRSAWGPSTGKGNLLLKERSASIFEVRTTKWSRAIPFNVPSRDLISSTLLVTLPDSSASRQLRSDSFCLSTFSSKRSANSNDDCARPNASETTRLAFLSAMVQASLLSSWARSRSPSSTASEAFFMALRVSASGWPRSATLFRRSPASNNMSRMRSLRARADASMLLTA